MEANFEASALRSETSETLRPAAEFTNSPSQTTERAEQPSSTGLPIESKKSLEGERKVVSILFADLSGFTSLSEKLDPEKVTDMMNACFRRLGKKVSEHSGFIDKFMGDCIMALFGAPIAHENDPELAIRCALGMLEELKLFNKEEGLELGLSIGINSGMVIAGGVGSDEKVSYTVMGDAVNVAQRLQSAAKSNEIFVSRNIFHSTERIFNFDKLEPIKLKGKDQPVEIFRVISTKKIGEETVKQELNSEKLVGRDRELDLARCMIDRAKESQGQIFCVAGDAGVGKSRFKMEVKKIATEKGLRWLESKCHHLYRESPYYCFSHLIQSLLEIDAEQKIEDQLEAAEKLKDFNLDSVSIEMIYQLLKLPFTAGQSQLDASQKKRALFLAIKKLLIELSKQKPTLIYFEDLHWVDPISKELLHQVVESVHSHPIMIYGSFRNDFVHDWHDRQNFTQIKLSPLTKEQSVELVKDLLKVSEIPNSLVEIIEEKSDGNPLYVEEILKTLIDSGKIQKNSSSDSWGFVGEIDDVEIPTTLQGLIASRIDRLEDRTKQVLQYASVIGREFSDVLLRRAEILAQNLDTELSYLRKRELIFEMEAEIEEITYIFKHALTQQVAYEGILKKKRKTFHRQVANSIEDLIHRDQNRRREDYIEELAHHYVEAGEFEKAVFYLIESAQKSAKDFNNQGALKLYYKVLELFEEIKMPETDERYYESLMRIAEIHVLTGALEEASKNYLRIFEVATRLNNQILLCQISRRLGDICRLRGNSEEAFEYLNQSLAYAEMCQNQEERVRSLKALGSTYQLTHELDQSLEHFERGLKEAREINNPKIIAEYLNDIAINLINRNQLDEAKERLSEAVALAQEQNYKSLEISATLNFGVVEYYKQNFAEASNQFKQAALIAEKIGDFKNVLIATHNIGEVLKEFSQFEEALQYFKKSYELASEMGNEFETINNQILIGHIQSKLMKQELATKILNEAIAQSESKAFWPLLCDALYYLGLNYMELNQTELAQQAFEAALGRAKSHSVHQALEKIEKELNQIQLLKNLVEIKT